MLRISLSVFFGVLTVALVVLWVRSYFVQDVLRDINNNRLTSFGVTNGSVFFMSIGTRGMGNAGWSHQQKEPNSESPAYQWHSNGGLSSIFIPIWAIAAAAALGVYAPFRLSRFSLRTLLIATTLFAVVLGLSVWAAS